VSSCPGALLSAAVLVGLLAQPGAAVNVPQAAVVSANPEDGTPHVLDGEVESLAVAPDGLHVFAGGSFTKVDGVAQKSLVKLRPSDGARVTAFKSRTNARVKDMAVSGGRLYIGGTFKTVNAVAHTALAAVDPVTGALSADLNLPVAVTGGATTRYQQQCAAVFATSMRDVDVSPGGSHFVVVTTGAYRAGSLCDAAARWETAATGPSQQPTWVDDTGSDTKRIGRYEHLGRIGFMPWPAASRCLPPGSAPCRATCSAWAWTAP
jgi:hypothetical protein